MFCCFDCSDQSSQPMQIINLDLKTLKEKKFVEQKVFSFLLVSIMGWELPNKIIEINNIVCLYHENEPNIAHIGFSGIVYKSMHVYQS